VILGVYARKDGKRHMNLEKHREYILRKTHKKTLEIINIEILKEFALDLD
jgi:hypothetical protein